MWNIVLVQFNSAPVVNRMVNKHMRERRCRLTGPGFWADFNWKRDEFSDKRRSTQIPGFTTQTSKNAFLTLYQHNLWILTGCKPAPSQSVEAVVSSFACNMLDSVKRSSSTSYWSQDTHSIQHLHFFTAAQYLNTNYSACWLLKDLIRNDNSVQSEKLITFV